MRAHRRRLQRPWRADGNRSRDTPWIWSIRESQDKSRNANTGRPSWPPKSTSSWTTSLFPRVQMSMPGVGIKTAVTTLLTIRDARSFRTAGHLDITPALRPRPGGAKRPSAGSSRPVPATNNSMTPCFEPSGAPSGTTRLQDLQRPKTRQRYEAQRRRHLDGPPSLRLHPCDAPKRDTLRGKAPRAFV